MESKTFLIALCLCYWLATPCNSQQTSPTMKTKRLIEFGWDEPTTRFMRDHIAEMEQTPFEGCVFRFRFWPKNANPENSDQAAWGRRRFEEADIQPALDDLKVTTFKTFKHNFLRMSVTPADLDWFDDYSSVLNNIRLIARVAKAGNSKGILFDTEEYVNRIFTYSLQRDAKTKSFSSYASQVHLRGKQVMEAMQSEFPDIVVMFTYGYALPWSESNDGRKSMSETEHGLLASFIDGMVSEAKGKTRFIDGNELAYSYTKTSHFSKGRSALTRDLKMIVENPAAYSRLFTISHGIWMDYNWRQLGWNMKTPSRNPRNPALMEILTRQALLEADEYVWIYSETPQWWTAKGKPEKLPKEYDVALRNALQPVK